MTQNNQNPWIKSKTFDVSFILLPPLLATLALLFIDLQTYQEHTPIWAWFILVVGIDVSHVYSTLFRTYLNSKECQEHKNLFYLLPMMIWIIGIGIHSFDMRWFWTILAYVAVFHFIRQQYGLMRLYARHETAKTQDSIIEQSCLYMSMLYPIIHWHSQLPKNFYWFKEGDFIIEVSPFFTQIAFVIYVLTWMLHVMRTFLAYRKSRIINLPKNLLLLGTAVSWYVGIVAFNNDLAFTMTNIVSHGIPYMALIWAYGEKQALERDPPKIIDRFEYRRIFSLRGLPIFLLILMGLGYLEEGFWAGFVWREHLEVFALFRDLPQVTSRDTLNWLVPLLTLPQATHYVLDGFIWKIKNKEAHWNKIMLKSMET